MSVSYPVRLLSCTSFQDFPLLCLSLLLPLHVELQPPFHSSFSSMTTHWPYPFNSWQFQNALIQPYHLWASLGSELETIFLQNSEGILSSHLLADDIAVQVLILLLCESEWKGPSSPTWQLMALFTQHLARWHSYFIGRLQNSQVFSLGLSNFDRKPLFIKYKIHN